MLLLEGIAYYLLFLLNRIDATEFFAPKSYSSLHFNELTVSHHTSGASGFHLTIDEKALLSNREHIQ